MEQQSTCYNVIFQIIFVIAIAILLYIVLPHITQVSKVGLSHGTSRFLGVYEDAFNLCRLERDGCLIICLVFALKSKKKLLIDHVQDALVLVAKRQPMLRAIIGKSQRSLTKHEHSNYFEIIDSDNISALLDISASQVHASDWKDVWCDVAYKPFSGLLWRAVLLKEEYTATTKTYVNTLVFSFNHACVDGVSSIKFAKQFFKNLNMIAERSATFNESRLCNEDTYLPLHSDVTELLKNKKQTMLRSLCEYSGLSFVLKLLFKRKLRRGLANKQINPFFVKYPLNHTPPLPPATKLSHKVYTKAETTKIINACKLNNCTVTGALMAIAHIALCQMLKDESQLEHGVAINAKRSCRPIPQEDYFGHFALSWNITLRYVDNDGDFWKLAQESTEQIHRILKDEEYIEKHIVTCESFNPKEMLNEIISPHERVESNRISCCNGISSAGSFNFNEGLADPVHELDYCMYWNVQGTTNALTYYNVTVNGKMSWTVAYDPRKISDGQAQQLSNWCFEHLLSFSQSM